MRLTLSLSLISYSERHQKCSPVRCPAEGRGRGWWSAEKIVRVTFSVRIVSSSSWSQRRKVPGSVSRAQWDKRCLGAGGALWPLRTLSSRISSGDVTISVSCDYNIVSLLSSNQQLCLCIILCMNGTGKYQFYS